MRATLSILGLYNFDTSIFENIVVPETLTAADVIQNIIYDNAELELLYPEPDTMKYMIGLWSNRELPLWNRYIAAINAEYNPIENYNRTETWSDSVQENTQASTTGTSTQNATGNNTRSVVGYDSEEFTNESKNDERAQNSINNSESGTGARTNTSTHTGNVSGNIGVTTSQQMLEQEFNIIGKLDIYKVISESFKRRFCLMVY